MKRYFIAYREKDGSSFCGGLPWIAPSEWGFSDLESAKLEETLMNNKGYQDVAVFESDINDQPEEFTWDYVTQHKV